MEAPHELLAALKKISWQQINPIVDSVLSGGVFYRTMEDEKGFNAEKMDNFLAQLQGSINSMASFANQKEDISYEDFLMRDNVDRLASWLTLDKRGEFLQNEIVPLSTLLPSVFHMEYYKFLELVEFEIDKPSLEKSFEKFTKSSTSILCAIGLYHVLNQQKGEPSEPSNLKTWLKTEKSSAIELLKEGGALFEVALKITLKGLIAYFLSKMEALHLDGKLKIYSSQWKGADTLIKASSLTAILHNEECMLLTSDGQKSEKTEQSLLKLKELAIAITKREIEIATGLEHKEYMQVGLLSIEGKGLGLDKVAKKLNHQESTSKWSGPRRKEYVKYMAEKHEIDVTMFMPQQNKSSQKIEEGND